jgi:hypothetical protein
MKIKKIGDSEKNNLFESTVKTKGSNTVFQNIV